MPMKRHFVEFMSPGTFVCEVTTRPIETWDVEVAVKMAEDIVERYNATPFGFRFITRERGMEDLDSHITSRSGMYYLEGRIDRVADIEARARDDERTLLLNMKVNGWDEVFVNTKGYQWVVPLHPGDTILKVVEA